MSFLINDINMFLIIFVTFFISAVFVPIAKKVAFHVNALDVPNNRKVHNKPMPRMGGLAIFFAFIAGYILFAENNNQMLSILIGGFLIVIMGIFDDIKPIKASYKFLVQVIAACIVVFYGDIILNHISAFGFVLDFPTVIAELITILFIVSFTNAINLIDGLDGLAAGVSSIYFATIVIIGIIVERIAGLEIMLSLIMLGSTLGFLLYNFNPASIFMGDTGSLFLGYMISIIALLGFKATTLTSLIVPILILSIPILDTALAIGRRLLKHESIGKPDKEHFHHQLLKMKFGMRKTVLIIYGINILFSAVSIFYIKGDNEVAIAIYVLLMILMLFLVLKTDILYKHKK